MHVVPVPDPLIGLSSNLIPLTLGVAFRNESVTVKVVAEVFRDEAGLGQDEWLLGVGTLDADNGGFAQGMGFLELLGSQHVGSSLVGLEFIVDLELLEEPEDALGAGFLQPVSLELAYILGKRRYGQTNRE